MRHSITISRSTWEALREYNLKEVGKGIDTAETIFDEVKGEASFSVSGSVYSHLLKLAPDGDMNRAIRAPLGISGSTLQ